MAKLGGIFGLVPATGREGQEFVDLVRAIGECLKATTRHVDTATLKRAILGCLPQEEGERILEAFAEQWIREGTERGIEQGIEQGIEIGRERERLHRRQVLLRLLERRSGFLTEETRSRIAVATSEMLDEWTVRVMDADEPDDVFFNGR